MKFLTGDVYFYLRASAANVQWASVALPSRGIPRHGFHCWLVIRNRLTTRDMLLRWRLSQPSMPPLELGTWISLSLILGLQHLLWFVVAGLRKMRSPASKILGELTAADGLSHYYSCFSTSRGLGMESNYVLALEWNDTRLHANTFRSVDSLFTVIDLQLKNKIQSFIESNPSLSSTMMQCG